MGNLKKEPRFGIERYGTYQTMFMGEMITMYNYDYRHTDGRQFNTIASTLEACRKRRDYWLRRIKA